MLRKGNATRHRSSAMNSTINTVLCALFVSAFYTLLWSPVQAAEPKVKVDITYIERDEDALVPLSLIDLPIEDNGRRGAEQGMKDTKTTGSFLGHEYNLAEVAVAPDADIASEFKALYDAGSRLFVANLEADDLLAIAAVASDSLIFNVRSKEDRLRGADCRANLIHVSPSYSMVTDGLAQYLAWKRWRNIAIVIGRHDLDQRYGDAMRRAAKRYGLKIREEKQWTSVPGARRTDSGHHSLQQEIPAFTQLKDHDVLVVADELDEFGEYMLFRTSTPRPVAGTQGLVSTQWHRSQEQWGATQMQRRFTKLAGRPMTERDYSAWAAIRTIGESVTKVGNSNVGELREYLLSDDFKLAGFKGVALTYRTWNGQLRQPMLVVGPRMLVSVSPQDGFLHQRSNLDTMGFDEPESECEAFAQ